MVKYSIIVPVFDPHHKMDTIVEDCFSSIYAHSSTDETQIIEIRDVHGFPVAVNRGFRMAKGEFLFVVNSDIVIKDYDWITKMAVPGVISSWRLHPFFITGKSVPDGACWCMSRAVFEQIGVLDEQFADGYGFEDSDYWMRAEEQQVPFYDAHVNLVHLENKTFQAYHKHRKQWLTEKNEYLFREKWKEKLAQK
jgi:GT2 family glycosyltransferase